MSTFTRLRVQGFRRLADVEIELRPLCVAIGANGCGKTSLLDVFSLLASSARGELEDAVKGLGGLTSCLTRDGRNQVAVEVAHQTPCENAALMQRMGDQLEYHIGLDDFGFESAIADEWLLSKPINGGPAIDLIRRKGKDVSYLDTPFPFSLSVDDNGTVKSPEFLRPNWPQSVDETALVQAPRHLYTIGWFRDVLASCTYFKTVDVGPRSPIRLPQPLRPAQLPGKDGEDLLSCLYTMREQHRDRYETIEDTLRAAFRSFEKLELPLVASGMVALGWKDANFTRAFYANELGEGMLRFLWLVTLLQSPGLTAVTLIDEPEVSLHPELLNLLSQLLREASLRTQVVVATHSDRLVRFLEPKEVLAFDVNEAGFASAKWADSMDVEKWLDEYTLDEVWRMGQLGGRA
jgi:predicted ATPase